MHKEDTLNEIKKKNNEIHRINSVNNRMSQYYSGEADSSEGINKFIKYIFYILLSIIIIVFIAKKQYTNQKISFYIMFLYLITYCLEPIHFYIRYNTYEFGEFFSNYFIVYFLFIVFGTFLGFKNYIFESDKNMKYYYYSLIFTLILSFFLIIYRYFTYNWS